MPFLEGQLHSALGFLIVGIRVSPNISSGMVGQPVPRRVVTAGVACTGSVQGVGTDVCACSLLHGL